MFESLDDPTPPPVPVELDALRSWHSGRNRVRQRFAAVVSGLVVLAGGCFALVDQPTSDAVVSSAPKVERDFSTSTSTPSTTTPTTVAPVSDSVAPIVGVGDDGSDGGAPSPRTGTGNGNAPSAPGGGTTPAPDNRSEPAPGTPADPGTATPAPSDDPNPPAPPSTPTTTAPPADPGPPPPPADEVWTVTSQSLTSIQSGTTPVMDITFEVRNNTATARYVMYYSCNPAYNWFEVDPGDPSALFMNTGIGSGCVMQFMWVQPNSQETRTISATLKVAGGPIPVGDYDAYLMFGLSVPVQVLP